MARSASLRRLGALTVLAAVVLAAPACQTVQAGTRCRAGSGFAKDATHVLTCKNGRWTRLATFGQAAQIVLGSRPAHIEQFIEQYDTVTVGQSNAVTVTVRVLRANMAPANGVTVHFALPTSGPSGTPVAGTDAVTDADGKARLSYVPNTVAGGWQMTASVDGVERSATVFAVNRPDEAASVEILSGGDQQTVASQAFPDPFSARFLDRFGNVVTDDEVYFDYDDTFIEPSDYSPPSAGNGAFRFRARALTSGDDLIVFGVQRSDGDWVVGSFHVTA